VTVAAYPPPVETAGVGGTVSGSEAPDRGELLRLAVTAAEAAGRLLLEAQAAGATGIGSKTTPTDLVSDADRASEDLVTRTLLAARPDDSVLGEEGGGHRGSSDVLWVVDPLDGTVNFLYGYPAFAVSVAAQVGDEVVAGAVHDPLRGETFTALRGAGSWLGERRLEVTRPAGLATSLVGTGFAYDAAARARQGRAAAALLPRVRDLRRAGAAALDLCWVGAARLDAYYESGTHVWDRAAGGLVASEAGAWVGGLHGAPPGDGMCVAAAPSVAAELVALLEELTADGA
jgi:myo-inositol-1(or 4)-monophosphatase